jgi:predicted phage tail protein
MLGDGVTISASSIADAIEGASTQLTNWPRKLALSVVGYNSVEEMKNNAPDEVHLMPAMTGGSAKVFNFVIGAALIITGILLLGTPFGVPLIVAGATMVLQGIVMLFMKTPKVEAEDNPEDSKYLGLNRNTTAARTPVTIAYGRVKLFPHWLSLQSDSSLMAHGSFPTNPT